MKIYKVTLLDNNLESEGFKYFTSKSEANKELKKYNKNFDCETGAENKEISISLTKREVVDLLNEHASHNDNG